MTISTSNVRIKSVMEVIMNILDDTCNSNTIQSHRKQRNFIPVTLIALFVVVIILLSITGCKDEPSSEQMLQTITTANSKAFGITSALTEIADFQKIAIADLKNRKIKGVSAWKILVTMEKKEGGGKYYAIYLISKTPKLGLSAYREPYNATVSSLGNFTTDQQVISRYEHIYAINIFRPDAVTMLWVRERYTYPLDLSTEKLPITAINGENLSTNLKIDIKVDNVIATWDSTNKVANISDLMSGKKVTIRKGDKPVAFHHYGSFESGRILEFVVK
jgi:hypothetical protein